MVGGKQLFHLAAHAAVAEVARVQATVRALRVLDAGAGADLQAALRAGGRKHGERRAFVRRSPVLPSLGSMPAEQRASGVKYEDIGVKPCGTR